MAKKKAKKKPAKKKAAKKAKKKVAKKAKKKAPKRAKRSAARKAAPRQIAAVENDSSVNPTLAAVASGLTTFAAARGMQRSSEEE